MKKKIVVLVVCVISIFLGVIALHYPGKDSGLTEFSYDKAKEDLAVIAEEPHSTLHHPEALARVREYIVGELEQLGLSPKVFHYADVVNDKGDSADLYNVFTQIDGVDGENGNYLLLMAHYDSAGNNPQNDEGYSFGAADDGYGVATILEVLRMVKNSGKTPINGIKVLITDGEEMHLIGSREEFEKNFDLYENVGFVINLEARGTSGPAVLFQTMMGNRRLISLYEEGSCPVTSSLVTDLYQESGRSDMLNLIDKGIPGINLTVLDHVEYYHTPDDAYQSINDRSLQHYGDQVLPIVERFIYSEEYRDTNYLKKGSDMVFFTLFPNIVVKYSKTFGLILSILVILAAVVLLVIDRKHLKAVLCNAAKSLVFFVTSAVVGFGISYGLAALAGKHFTLSHMGKVPGDDILVVVVPILIFGTYAWLSTREKSKMEHCLAAGLLLQTVLGVVVMFLPGAGYLVAIPTILTLLALLFRRLGRKTAYQCFLLLTAAMVLILYIPVMYILIMAFSLVSLPFLLAITTVAGTLVVPGIRMYLAE